MEMCYDGALVMPSSYAVMNEDEMTYVEGGATYRGKAALNQLTNMAAVVLGYAGTVASLARVLTGGLVASGTGIGCVVALAATLGLSASLALCAYNSVCLGMAAYYYVKYKAFKVNSVSSCGYTIYTYVGKA